ncbi:MAG: AAA family ATPase [Candidatus Peribacter sp.]|nr:AAA family ATPase [Candidatus Peribacter sp.]MBT6056716.1 AAA family ATPase [Gammaproteobacteria bacterium]MBT7338530.1 AAA family ATPase [Candidatus Jacksonbacteria bacterium]
MRDDRVDFSRYGKAFQEGLVQLIFEDRPFADQITEVLDIQFIELEYLRLFTTLIVDYREKYETHPSVDIMLVLLRTEMDDEDEVVQSQTREYFAKIHTKELTDIKYIKETALDFCRKQNLKEAMMESVGLLQKCSFDEISTVINNALKLGSDNNFGYDYLKDFEARFVPKYRKPVTTGWPEIDTITGGGLGKSELGVVIAPTGAGKSMALVHLGTQAIKEGKTVVHYTLELQDTVVASRYDSCLTGYPLSDIINFKEEIYEAIGDVDGSLIVKEYPTKSATTNTVRSHLSRLIKRGIKPGLVIVDYADLLKPVIVRKEKRNELESIYEDLRGLSTEFKCPIWTASQTNRSGLSAEVITMEQISEAFNKCFVADFIFSISRTIEDKQNNQGKMFIAKNRNGPDGIIYPIFMDTSNVKIRILPTATTAAVGSMPTQAPLGVKQQQTLLRQKYTKLRRK